MARWRERLALALTGVVLLATAGAQAQESGDEVVRLSSDLVLVPIVAIDAEGRPVHDLAIKDVRLLEDGRAQEIAFLHPDRAPLDVVLLIDRSSSIENSLEMVQRAAYALVKQLGPNDAYSIVSFADIPAIALDWGKDARAAARALRDLRPQGNTALYGSLVASMVERFDGRPADRRRAVVVVTDGDDTASSVTSRVAVREALTRDITVMVISSGRYWAETLSGLARMTALPAVQRADYRRAAERVRRAEERLEYVARETGGRVTYPKAPTGLEKACQSVADELRSRYLLGYYTTSVGDPGYRGITVRCVRSGARLFARQGFYR